MNWEKWLSFSHCGWPSNPHHCLLCSNGRIETMRAARLRLVAPNFIHLLVKHSSIED